MENGTRLNDHLRALYGEPAAGIAMDRLSALMDAYSGRISQPGLDRLNQRDVLLITYGDQISQVGESPLQTLAEFCKVYLSGVVSGIHILPFFPFSSDDGFSVIDYLTIDPALGNWQDIERFRQNFFLMFDAVINHTSVQSDWFQEFLRGDPRYRDYFISVPDGADLSVVVRPRALPMLTSFEVGGQRHNIWTTFSPDQVDLNYANPDVLLEMINILLAYAERGARLIRLDAIAFLWKTYGTTCLHLPQTHRVIQLIRAVLDRAAPHVLLITETNVAHTDNLSYFGNGKNEAQLVYNFGLPPLVLHTLLTGSAEILSDWASALSLPSGPVTFFNFLASHDGIGLNPARGILSSAQIDALVEGTLKHGGLVSYKNNPDGTTSPYELNINYFDALSNPGGAEPEELQADRFMASQAILLAFIGMPGIYFHSLLGSRGWREGVNLSGHNRTINRQKCVRVELEAQLGQASSLRHNVFYRYAHLLRLRAAQPAFDPYGNMTVLDAGPQLFAVLRSTADSPPVVCLQNVTSRSQSIPSPLRLAPGVVSGEVVDLVSGQVVNSANELQFGPYQTRWLTGLRPN